MWINEINGNDKFYKNSNFKVWYGMQSLIFNLSMASLVSGTIKVFTYEVDFIQAGFLREIKGKITNKKAFKCI